MQTYLRNSIIVMAAFTLLIFSACEKDTRGEVVTIVKDSFTAEENVIIGDRLNNAIERNPHDFPPLDTSKYTQLYEYLNNLYNMIANNAIVINRNIYSWQVRVLRDDSRMTAFTAPDGRFYIFTGLLKFIQSEHELLSIMGHEIFYVEQGKVTMSLKDKFKGAVLGDILLDKDVSNIDDLANWLKEITYSENKVLEADAFSVDLVCPFLYDPMGIKSFLEHTESVPSDHMDWLNKRPASIPMRISTVEEHAVSCGDFGRFFKERYQSFISQLP